MKIRFSPELGASEDRTINGVRVGRYSYFPWSDEHLARFVHSVGRFTSINETAYIHRNHPLSMTSTSLGLLDIFDGNDRAKYLKTYVKSAHSRNLGHKVKIGNDVWIGANVFINASTVSEIGDGAVIGAGAIVTHNVPPYSVVLGIPGKVVKYRFLEGRIAELLEIKWWNWTDDEIRANLDFFAKTDGKV